MPTYQESCPRGLTSKVITFSIEGKREPAPTKNCICRSEMEQEYIEKYGPSLPLMARVFMLAALHTSKIRKISE